MADDDTDTDTGTDAGQGRAHKAGAFDIRTFIALLIGIYGVVLVLVGLFDTQDADLDRADGLNINLWAGLGMVVVGVLFQAWAKWRPVIVPDAPEDQPDDEIDREK